VPAPFVEKKLNWDKIVGHNLKIPRLFSLENKLCMDWKAARSKALLNFL
jgi:hypothetical protein